MPENKINKPTLIGLGLIWALSAALGMGWLAHYQNTPGQAAAAENLWPGSGALKLAADRPTLLMFVHPECSCSRASIGELERLLTVCGNRVAVQMFFFKPAGRSDDWSHTDLWNNAQSLPGVQVRIDSGGQIAKAFGAKTSGQVLIYNPQGRLLFNGGLTEGRSHFGDSAALDAAITIVQGTAPSASGVVTANVYGCPINSPTTAPSSGAGSPSAGNRS